jgi:hypothetical protein
MPGDRGRQRIPSFWSGKDPAHSCRILERTDDVHHDVISVEVSSMTVGNEDEAWRFVS